MVAKAEFRVGNPLPHGLKTVAIRSNLYSAFCLRVPALATILNPKQFSKRLDANNCHGLQTVDSGMPTVVPGFSHHLNSYNKY